MFKTSNHNVVYADPPWETEGRPYKSYTDIKLMFGDIPLEEFVNKLLDPDLNLCCPKLIVLKLPRNYDYEYFISEVHVEPHQIIIEEVNKINIVIVTNF